jgi:hypothetical protein
LLLLPLLHKVRRPNNHADRKIREQDALARLTIRRGAENDDADARCARQPVDTVIEEEEINPDTFAKIVLDILCYCDDDSDDSRDDDDKMTSMKGGRAQENKFSKIC